MGEMRYRKLGKWGLKVSEISLGAWVTFGDVVKDKETVREIVGIAYEGGVNFFDNADVYAKGLAEEIMGEILQEFPRHTLVLSTKAYWPMSEDPNDRGLSRKHLWRASRKASSGSRPTTWTSSSPTVLTPRSPWRRSSTPCTPSWRRGTPSTGAPRSGPPPASPRP